MRLESRRRRRRGIRRGRQRGGGLEPKGENIDSVLAFPRVVERWGGGGVMEDIHDCSRARKMGV